MHRVSYSVLLSAVLVLFATECYTAPVLQKVFVLVRHGARSAFTYDSKGNMICDAPYCQLTDSGKAQAATVGKFLRARYNALLDPIAYNVTTMQSVSTSPKRVLLTAEALLVGMYDDALPFVDYVPDTADIQMSWWASWPSFIVNDPYTAGCNALNDWTTQYMGQPFIDRVSTELGMQVLCASGVTRCIAAVADAFLSNVSNGVTVPRWVQDEADKLTVVAARTISRGNGFYNDSAYSSMVGSFGYPLASAALATLTAPFAPSGFNYNFILRAAHDWTIVGFLAALGTWTPQVEADPQFAPTFAEAILLEMLVDDITAVPSLRAFRATTTQEFNPSYDYTTTAAPIGVRCLSDAGVLYWSNETAGGNCPLADVSRFINTTAGLAPYPPCHLTAANLVAENCDTDDAPAAGSNCAFYRQVCPGSGCGLNPDAIADVSAGYACATLASSTAGSVTGPTSSNDVPTTQYAIVTAAGALIGTVVGFAAVRFRSRAR